MNHLFISLLIIFTSTQTLAEKKDTAKKEVSPISQLERAYQREFAFLQAQKRSLSKQLGSIHKLYEGQISKAQAEVDQLRGQTVRTGIQSQDLSNDFQQLQKNIETLDESEEQITKVFEQSEETLKTFGSTKEQLDYSKDEPMLALLNRFNLAIQQLNKVSQVNISDQQFYGQNGELLKGQVASIGAVAKVAQMGKQAAILVPSGNGPFKVTQAIPEAAAKKIFEQQTLPKSLNVFLFDNPNQAVEAKVGKTVLGIINSGGTIAWVIVALGLIGFVLIVLRYLLLKNVSYFNKANFDQVKQLVIEDKQQEAVMAMQNNDSSIHKLIGVMVENLKKPKDVLEDIFNENFEKERLKADRLATIIIVIASIAPLLGLLGTVTGMISTFDIITEYGTGDPKLLSGGISEALVTTKLGLVVAIPTLFFGTLLSGWGKKIKSSMETIPLELFNSYYEGKKA